MRNYLLNGHTEIFGAGKGIIRSFQDFDLCTEAVLDKDRYIPQEILNTADF